MKRFLQIALATIFLSAFSLPALATDYYYDATDGSNANDCSSPAQACQTIGDLNGQDLNSGDTVFLQCGEVWADATLTLAAGDSGSSGNPVTLTNYGTCGANPKINGTGRTHAARFQGDWITSDGVDFTGSSGGAGSDVVEITGDNVTLTQGEVTGNHDTSPGGGEGIHIDGAANTTISFFAVSKVNRDWILFSQLATNCNLSNITFGDALNVSGVQDMLALNSDVANGCTGDHLTFNNTVAAGENGIDVKNGDHNFSFVTILSTNDAAIIVADPNTAANVADVTISDSGIGNSLTPGRNAYFRESVTVTLLRDRFSCDTCGSEIIRVGGDVADSTVVNFYGSACEIESGDGAPYCFNLAEGDLNVINSTVVVRNGAGAGTRAIFGDGGWGGTLTARNDIIAGDGIVLIETNNAGATLDLGYSLYDCDQATCADDNGTTYSLAQIISSLDANGATGDPLFVTEDETSDLFLNPKLGSPAILLGDGAVGPATDLLGYTYRVLNGSKDAGARAYRWRQIIRHGR